MGSGHALFRTAIGYCGVAWSERGITRLTLPGASGRSASPRARIPPRLLPVISKVRLHLSGKPQDLAGARLDLAGVPAFHRRVYLAARAIPPGRTLSYGELAARVGSPRASRAVGQAMARNPFGLLVPCHRVVGARDRLVGFSARGGIRTKARLLDLEKGALEKGV